MRLTISKLLILLLISSFAVTVAAAAAPIAAADTCETCEWDTDEGDGGDTGDGPAATTTTISVISPSFAWSGDTITLTGSGFKDATVSINSLPATISSGTDTRLIVIVPTISNNVAGPVTIPVVVSSPTGTASTSFTLSPTLQLSTWATFGVNAQFGQGGDGRADATATLDRSSGFAVSELTVRNGQALSSLVVNMSTVWLDSTGRVVGFTDPEAVAAHGWFPFSWPNVETVASRRFTQVVRPNPAAGTFARSARIVLVRDRQAELLDTLNIAVAAGHTIAQVIAKLAAFLA